MLASANRTAWQACEGLRPHADRLRIVRHLVGSAAVWDFGVSCLGGLEAGRQLALICLGGLGEVTFTPADPRFGAAVDVTVRTDAPLMACLGSQYAGWKVQEGGYFAMASGPMRLLAGQEPLLAELELNETADCAVGVLESSGLPDQRACEMIAQECDVTPDRLSLCVARARSLGGTVQVVARSVETALHKMHYLGMDPRQVRSGWGSAPLPPPSSDDLTSIGRTNDAILYGGRVVLWVEGDDRQLADLAPQIPSRASKDYGSRFADLFRRYEGDFYKIDPLLFSPASIVLVNLATGSSFRSGETQPDMLADWLNCL